MRCHHRQKVFFIDLCFKVNDLDIYLIAVPHGYTGQILHPRLYSKQCGHPHHVGYHVDPFCPIRAAYSNILSCAHIVPMTCVSLPHSTTVNSATVMRLN